MSDFHALHKDSLVDATDAPGQTFLSLTGEGGRLGDDGADTELCVDREPFEAWFQVSRPPDNSDYEETEYIVTRLGGNDVVPVASRNLKIQAAVRTALGRDLAKGEFVHYTGNGTAECYVDYEPDGTITIANDNGGGNTAVIVFEPSTGNVDMTVSGEVRIGGAAATDYVTLFTALKAAYDLHTHTNPPPLGATGVPIVPLPNTARATKGRAI